MVLVEDNWIAVHDLQDISNIIREYYNRDLADELDKMIPEHTDREYDDLEWKLEKKDDKITDLITDYADLDSERDRLEEEVERLEKELEELRNT